MYATLKTICNQTFNGNCPNQMKHLRKQYESEIVPCGKLEIYYGKSTFFFKTIMKLKLSVLAKYQLSH